MASLRSYRFITISALAISIAGPIAVAQGNGKKETVIEMSAEAKEGVVRRAFQNEIQGTLEKYLKPHQYNVEVSLELNKSAKGGDDVPYAPDNIVADAYQGLPTGKQFDQIKDLKVSVQVPKWVDEGTKQTLRALAEKSLSEKTGRPVKVGIESVALDVEEPKKDPLPRPEPRAAAPAASAPMAAPASPGSASPAAADLARAMDEIKDLKKKMEETQAAQAAAAGAAAGANSGAGNANANTNANGANPANGSNAQASGSANLGDSWLADLVKIGKEYPIAMIIALLLLYIAITVIVLIPSRSMVSGFKQINTAFEALSRALKGIGDAMGQSRSRDGEGQDKDAEGQAKDAAAILGAPLESSGGKSSAREISLEEVNQRIQNIRSTHKPDYDRIVVDLVVSYLHDSEKSYWAVFLLDMVGREHARRVFESLDAADQEELMRLVKHSVPEDKMEASIELVDAYQMRLLTFGWKGGGKSRSLDPDLQRMISQLAFEDIAPVLNRLGETGIRRFMLYLDSKTVGQLIRSVRRNPQSQKFLISLLARMPEAIHEQMVDSDIMVQINAHFQKKQDDLYLPYLTQYEEIVGQVGDDLEDEIIEQLSEANADIGNYLKRKLVTLGTFFSLAAKDQKDLLSSFTNNDFALLISMLQDDGQKAVVGKLLDAGRKELVTEQLSILSEESKVHLAERHKEIRRRIRNLLKQQRSTSAGAEFIEGEETSIKPRGQANGAA